MFPVPTVVLVVGNDWNRCSAEGCGCYGVSARDRDIMKDGDVKSACENMAFVLHQLTASKEVGDGHTHTHPAHISAHILFTHTCTHLLTTPQHPPSRHTPSHSLPHPPTPSHSPTLPLPPHPPPLFRSTNKCSTSPLSAGPPPPTSLSCWRRYS